jgi:hypothetical protein
MEGCGSHTYPAYVPAVQAATHGLPCLKRLACDAGHVQLLLAVAAHCPRLAHIKLSSKTELSAANRSCWETLPSQLLGKHAISIPLQQMRSSVVAGALLRTMKQAGTMLLPSTASNDDTSFLYTVHSSLSCTIKLWSTF